jgi:ABC-2 type transport system permease protein
VSESARTSPGLLRNGRLIAQREYLDRVRSRTFMAATVVLVAVAIGLALAPIGIRYIDRGSVIRIGILAAEPDLRAKSIAVLDGILNKVPDGADPATWQKPYRFETVADAGAAAREVDQGELRGVLSVVRAADRGLDFTFRTSGGAGSTTSQVMQFAAFGVGVLDAGAQFRPPNYAVESTTGATDAGRPIGPQAVASRSVLATVLIILIFITLTIYGMWVATSVAAEKSTRVMELLISAATPRQLLVGKVVGVGGAGLTQYLAILIPASIVVLLQDPLSVLLLGPGPVGEAPLQGLTLPILGAFLMFFVLGFILYALLYAAAGSLVSRQEDVQQLALPLSLISMASYIIAVAGLASIGSTFMFVMSFVPFSSPFVMLARILVGRVEPWEIVLSAGILAVSSAFVLVLASRIYATGVVLYGQRPGIRAFIRAARTAMG